MGWCLLSVSLMLGCGGATRDEVDDPGPPHEGWGLYELTIERVRDDCEPPLVRGMIGQVVVVVEGPHANIPVYEVAPDGAFDPARSDISLEEPYSFDIPIGLPADCGDASWHIGISVPMANAERIDVAYQRVLAGVSACRPEGEAQDCTSERIFHFRWLHACQDNGDVTECLEP